MRAHAHSWTFHSQEGDLIRFVCTRCEATITKPPQAQEDN